jgi:SAM-dependent methyltransferase
LSASCTRTSRTDGFDQGDLAKPQSADGEHSAPQPGSPERTDTGKKFREPVAAPKIVLIDIAEDLLATITLARQESAEGYVRGMSELLERHAAKFGRTPTVVDLGCGDFEVGHALVARFPDLTYVGCGIVPELIAHNTKTYADERISFRRLDIVADPFPVGDVCLVRQVLQHLSNAEIMRFLNRMNYMYLYITEGDPSVRTGPVNPDKPTRADVRFDWPAGRGCGVELGEPPFCLSTREVFSAPASFPMKLLSQSASF